MEMQRRDKIAAKMLQIELEMKRHLEISNRKCKMFYEQNKKLREEIEIEAKLKLEQQDFFNQKQQIEKLQQLQKEKLLMKEKRSQQLNLNLQKLDEKLKFKDIEPIPNDKHKHIPERRHAKELIENNNSLIKEDEIVPITNKDSKFPDPDSNSNAESTPDNKSVEKILVNTDSVI